MNLINYIRVNYFEFILEANRSRDIITRLNMDFLSQTLAQTQAQCLENGLFPVSGPAFGSVSEPASEPDVGY